MLIMPAAVTRPHGVSMCLLLCVFYEPPLLYVTVCLFIYFNRCFECCVYLFICIEWLVTLSLSQFYLFYLFIYLFIYLFFPSSSPDSFLGIRFGMRFIS